MKTDEIIRELRQTATNASPGLHRLLCAAAERLEELDERVAIMMEGNQITMEEIIHER